MATQIQKRRGTASEHQSFTGAVGEITVNTTNDSAHVHDGATAGGFELARADGQNANMPTSAMPAGSVIQVQTVQVTNPFTQSISGNTDNIISDFDLNITPFSSNSIMLFQLSILVDFDNDNQAHDHLFTIFRNSTKLGQPDPGNDSRNYGIAPATRTYYAEGGTSTLHHLGVNFMDQPNTTSSITYRVSINGNQTTTLAVNRSISDGDALFTERGASTFTVMEIAG